MTKRCRLAAALAALLPAALLRGASDRPIAPIAGALPALADGAPLLFVVGGDNRPSGHDGPFPRVTRTIFSEIALIRPDFVLWTGDTVYGYYDSARELSAEYDRFTAAAREGGSALFNAPGNHEIHHLDRDPCTDRSSEEAFARRFGNLYGSFDAGGAHFIALDTEPMCSEDRVDADQRAWLERDLEANRNARAIFVFSHTEFFSSPTIDPDAAKGHPPIADREGLIALFRKYPVRAVFCGHEHVYSHENHEGIDFFVAGGSGAPLYAPPDRGGFSHYVVVRLEKGELAWDVVEPGRLYVETGPDLAGRRTTWIVNGTDADVPVRGAWIDAPPSLGSCRRLTAETGLKKRGVPVELPASVAGCAVVNGRRRARVTLVSPRGTSIPVSIGRGGAAKRGAPAASSP